MVKERLRATAIRDYERCACAATVATMTQGAVVRQFTG
jgi:hypothetical protein